MTKRVYITGIGVVTPIGIGRAAFTEALFRGENGIREIEAFDTSRFSSHLGAEIKDFHARDFIPEAFTENGPAFSDNGDICPSGSGRRGHRDYPPEP